MIEYAPEVEVAGVSPDEGVVSGGVLEFAIRQALSQLYPRNRDSCCHVVYLCTLFDDLIT